MKKLFFLSIIIMSFGCKDLVDFTEVENPNLSESSVVGQPNSSLIWLAGMERQLANVLNEVIINSEIASDNYENTQTFFNQFLDVLDINAQDDDLNDMQFAIARLREMATFGKTQVGPNDENYTTATEAEYNFLEGMANLYAAMYFSGLPGEALGEPLSAQAHYTNAVSSFEAAIGLNPLPEYHLAQARALYYLGDKAKATTAAAAAISAGGADFSRFAGFDELNDPDNVMEDALYERGTFDDLQPLPTLDFLDPKYSFNTAEKDDDIHYLKAEEAWLIQIEGLISDGDLGGAQDMMKMLVALVNSRNVKSIDESIEGRSQLDPGSRPDTACVVVNGRAGLVIERDLGPVEVPSISGTSLTDAEIDAISGEVQALEILYRTRQEIFIAEGIRMVDMGVKFVIAEAEQLQNSRVVAGGLGTVPQVPGFIDAVKADLDGFTYVPGSCEATTTVDVNQILVANRADAMVLPFH